MVKLWLDDIRTPPDENWIWAKTVDEAKTVILDLLPEKLDTASFDNDLGEGIPEGRTLVLWMAEMNERDGIDVWPEVAIVHSANPVASQYMQEMIWRYKP